MFLNLIDSSVTGRQFSPFIVANWTPTAYRRDSLQTSIHERIENETDILPQSPMNVYCNLLKISCRLWSSTKVLFLNLNRFICNWPPVLSIHCGKLDTNSLSPRLTTDIDPWTHREWNRHFTSIPDECILQPVEDLMQTLKQYQSIISQPQPVHL